MRSVFLTYGLGILLLSSLFVTCKRDERADDARKIVSEWTGKQIEFPKGIPCFAMGKDTDCVPTWNQQPVAPGTTTEINVEVTPDIYFPAYYYSMVVNVTQFNNLNSKLS